MKSSSTRKKQWLLIALLFLYANFIFCQDEKNKTKITYHKSNVTILELFHDLEKEYGITFSYDASNSFSDNVQATFEEDDIEDILDYLLPSRNMEYKIISNNVLIRKINSNNIIHSNEYSKKIHIKGKVKSINNNENLSYATISISNSTIGTYTNNKGEFDILIPIELINEELIISYIGFTTINYKIKELEEMFLLVPLSEAENLVENIEIINREKPIKLGKYNDVIVFNKAQIQNNTSGVSGTNIIRNLQMIPGITAHNDNNSDLIIRGSNSDGSLIILDGIPIYQTSHHFGIFSTLNASYIDSINLYKNNIPINIDGKTAGIIEMFSDQEINTKLQAELDLNLLTGESKLNIPIGLKSNLILSGKTTWKSVDNTNFTTNKKSKKNKNQVDNFSELTENNSSSPSIGFHDIQGKYQWKNKKLTISSNFYYSSESSSNMYETDITTINNNNLQVGINEGGNKQAIGASLLANLKLSNKWKYSFNTYYSKNNESQFDNIALTSMSFPNNPNETIYLNANQNNQLKDIGQSHQFHWNNKIEELIIGGEINRKSVEYLFQENNKNIIEGTESLNKLSAFSSYSKQFNKLLFIRASLRSNYFIDLNKLYFSPRLLLNINITDRIVFKSSFSKYQQAVRQLYFEYRAIPMNMWVSTLNENIPMLQSTNYMVGGKYMNDYFCIDIEGYYKGLTGVTEYASLNPVQAENNPESAQDYRLFTGNGRIKGIDIILSSGYKNYDTYISYTLSKAEEKYRAINKNEYYPSELDRRHQLKWVNTIKLNNWLFGLNGIYSSGRLYTNITNSGINNDIRNSRFENRFNRLPAYKRVDISVNYLLKMGNQKIDLGFSVFNVLNNQNVEYIQSIITTVQEGQTPYTAVVGGESSLLNRTYNVGVKLYLSN